MLHRDAGASRCGAPRCQLALQRSLGAWLGANAGFSGTARAAQGHRGQVGRGDYCLRECINDAAGASGLVDAHGQLGQAATHTCNQFVHSLLCHCGLKQHLFHVGTPAEMVVDGCSQALLCAARAGRHHRG